MPPAGLQYEEHDTERHEGVMSTCRNPSAVQMMIHVLFIYNQKQNGEQNRTNDTLHNEECRAAQMVRPVGGAGRRAEQTALLDALLNALRAHDEGTSQQQRTPTPMKPAVKS